MLGEELSRALSDISDDKIEAAAKIVPKSRRHVWLRVAAVAAVVALVMTWLLWPTETENGIVSAPGILRAYACDLKDTVDASDLEKYELTDTIDSYKQVLVPHVSGGNLGFGIPFIFQIADDYFGTADISFLISADYGYFCVDGEENSGSQEVVIGTGDAVRWWYGLLREADERFGSCGRFYGNVIIYAEEKIVGYGVIDFIYYAEEGMIPSFVTNGFTTVCFPMVDGEFQNVSEEYVWEQIQEYKRTKPVPEKIKWDNIEEGITEGK